MFLPCRDDPSAGPFDTCGTHHKSEYGYPSRRDEHDDGRCKVIFACRNFHPPLLFILLFSEDI